MDPKLTHTVARLRKHVERLIEQPSTTALAALYDKARRLETLAADDGPAGLGDAAFAFSVFLSTFVQGAQLPDSRQMEKISALFDELASHCETPHLPADPSRVLLYLGDPALLPFGLAELCAERGLNLREIDDLSLLQPSPERRIAPTLLFDLREIERLESGLPPHGPVAALARLASLSPELGPDERLRLSRFGVEHFFVSPVVASEMLDRLFPDPRNAQSAPVDMEEASRPRRVIIVDDDASQAEFAAAILSNAGMDTLAIDDPREVLALASEFHPDLILIDLYMPELSGEELTMLLRRRREYRGIPLIYLSGELEKDRQNAALAAGADEFLEKPIRPKKLIKLVEKQLSAARHEPPPSAAKPAMARDPIDRLCQHVLDMGDRLAHGRAVALYIGLRQGIDARSEPLRPRLERLDARLGRQGRLEIIGERTLIGLLGGASLKNLIRNADKLHKALIQITDPDRRGGVRTGVSLLDEPAGPADWKRARDACAVSDGKRCGLDDRLREKLLSERFDAIQRRLTRNEPLTLWRRPLRDSVSEETLAYLAYPRFAEITGKRWAGAAIVRAPIAPEFQARLDQEILRAALDELRVMNHGGEQAQLLIPQSGRALRDAGFIPWLHALLRARQQTGSGLVCLFPMAEISRSLHHSRALFEQLARLGIAVAAFDVGLQQTVFRIAGHLGLEQLILSPRIFDEDLSRLREFIESRRDQRVSLVLPYSEQAAMQRQRIDVDGYLDKEQPGWSE